MKSFEPKRRREVRRLNHIAKDLHSPKYRQRIKESNKKDKWIEDDDDY